MAAQSFGKFKSIDDFLVHHASRRATEAADAERGLSFDEQVSRRRQQAPNIVEVAATLKQREGDDTSGAEHIQIFVTLTKLIQGGTAVDADIQRTIADGDDVFVAIRYGDSDGITQPIVGLVPGVALDLKGEYIPAAEAGAEGGRQVAVLHYTHHPVGFICVSEPPTCYQ